MGPEHPLANFAFIHVEGPAPLVARKVTDFRPPPGIRSDKMIRAQPTQINKSRRLRSLRRTANDSKSRSKVVEAGPDVRGQTASKLGSLAEPHPQRRERDRPVSLRGPRSASGVYFHAAAEGGPHTLAF